MPKGMKTMAEDIPHEYREKILLDWIPNAKPTLSNDKFKLLWEAYFIYIEPSGIQKTDCSQCLNNVFNNWKLMIPHLAKAEKNYNTIEAL